MINFERIEFVCFIWILIGIANFCPVHSHDSADLSATATANHENSSSFNKLDPVPVLINKCEPDSFNSLSDVHSFASVFGYLNYDLRFVLFSVFNRSRNQCTTETLKIPFNFNSSNGNLTAVSTPENTDESTKIHIKPQFWNHGFFNYEPNFFINPENYCVKKLENPKSQKTSQWILTVEICPNPDLNSNLNHSVSYSYFPPTFPKCCTLYGFLTINEVQNAKCEYPDQPPWKPETMENKGIYPNYRVSVPPCPFMIFILPYQLEAKVKRGKNSSIIFKDVRVLENGQVETQDTGNHKWEKLESNNYCIDGFTHQLTSNGIPAAAESFMILHCFADTSESSKNKDLIYAATSFISSFVLLIIVIVFGLIWREQNVHGWTKAAFSFSMFLWLFCTGVRILYKELDDFCTFIAVATHFSRISDYSWMLMLNFDIWSVISSVTARSQRSRGKRRFFSYCSVAMGIPTIVIAVSLVMENKFSLFDDSVIRPQYGRSRCYLDHTALKAYAIYPTMILFLPNLIILLLTIIYLIKARDNRRRLRINNADNKSQVVLCLRLFMVMGISWIFEIVSGLTDSDEVAWYWMITDIFNIFQPFLLFWLFVCESKVRDQLYKKYPILKAGLEWLEVYLPQCFSAPPPPPSISTDTRTGTSIRTESREI